jgi:hypothetical protein
MSEVPRLVTNLILSDVIMAVTFRFAKEKWSLSKFKSGNESLMFKCNLEFTISELNMMQNAEIYNRNQESKFQNAIYVKGA